MLQKLRINHKIFTSSKTSEFYSDHQWRRDSKFQVGPVINAVPDIKIADTVPWEEWFSWMKKYTTHSFSKKTPTRF